jgi:hypothetical protein
LINFGITFGTSSCHQARAKLGRADSEASLQFSIGSSLGLSRAIAILDLTEMARICCAPLRAY